MKTRLYLIATLLIVSFFANAQDPHFSQFFASPLSLHPALTGKFDGTLRVAGNYRNQWPTFNNVYTTSTLSIDFPILKSKLPDYDTWGSFLSFNCSHIIKIGTFNVIRLCFKS